MVFDGLGATTLLSALSQALESESDDVLRQARSIISSSFHSAHNHLGRVSARQPRQQHNTPARNTFPPTPAYPPPPMSD